MRIGRRRDVLAAAVSHGILVYGKKVADLDPSEREVLTDSMGVSQHVSDERRAALLEMALEDIGAAAPPRTAGCMRHLYRVRCLSAGAAGYSDYCLVTA